MTKEEILSNRVAGNDAGVYSDDEIYIAMDEWAKQQAISFINWTLESGCQYSCTDENQWTNINDPYDSITTAQLHDKFIEQQSQEQ
jgi:hypothetical protein